MLSDISQTQKDKHSMFSLNCRLQTVRERQRRQKKKGSHRRGKKPVRMGEDRRGWIGQTHENATEESILLDNEYTLKSFNVLFQHEKGRAAVPRGAPTLQAVSPDCCHRDGVSSPCSE